MSDVVNINRLSRPVKNMDLGGKIASLITVVNGLHESLLNHTLTAPGIVIGSSDPAKVKIAATTTFVVGGVFKSKTTAEVAFTATSHDIAAHASLVKEAVYTLSLKADLSAVLTMGTIAVGSGKALAPAAPAGQAVCGQVRIAVAAGATPFDASTDSLASGHLTVAYTDLLLRPADIASLIATLTTA
jgi:hypothetical protein